MLNTLLKLVLTLSLTCIYFLVKQNNLPRRPLVYNFICKNLIWILIYPVFSFNHTSDLIMYKNFLIHENSGLIPNRDFNFPYGPFFLKLFGLLNPLNNFNLWYFFLTLIDTLILRLILNYNKENSREVFWFWFCNPLIIVLTQVLGQNQILILLFSTLALTVHSYNSFRVSFFYSIGAIFVKMIQFLYLPGFFIYLWKKDRKVIALAISPVLIYCLIGLSITSKWFAGVQHEFNLLCPGNISFWIAHIFPKINLGFLNIFSVFCISSISIYCIRKFEFNENLFSISTFVTLTVFLLTSPRSYSQYWIYVFPLVCFISDRKLQKEIIFCLTLLSALVPIETSFYFNFILEDSFNKSFSWFALILLDLLILLLGFLSIIKLAKFQNGRTQSVD